MDDMNKYIILFSCIMLVLFSAKDSIVKASESEPNNSLDSPNDNKFNKDTSMESVESVSSAVGDIITSVGKEMLILGKNIDDELNGLIDGTVSGVGKVI